VIVWLNGVVGAGLTRAVCRAAAPHLPGGAVLDPRELAALLGRAARERARRADDALPSWPLWRRTVADTAAALADDQPRVVLVPMPLLRQDDRDAIFGALAARGLQIRHLLLHADDATLRGLTPKRGAAARLAAYREALPWLRADAYPIEVAGRDADELGAEVTRAFYLGEGLCEIVRTPEPTAETVAAGVLLFDEQDRVLLVDPTYKPGWEFPGGVVEAGEAPSRAAVREVAEELGLALAEEPRLLVVDWEAPQPPGHGGLRLLFDGGRLDAGTAAGLLLPGDELRGWRFVTEAEAAGMLPPVRFQRLRQALRARQRGTVLNLDEGIPVGPPAGAPLTGPRPLVPRVAPPRERAEP
jgi:ADP-ribose pyrophosphatase YjhB (NUDIX family)